MQNPGTGNQERERQIPSKIPKVELEVGKVECLQSLLRRRELPHLVHVECPRLLWIFKCEKSALL